MFQGTNEETLRIIEEYEAVRNNTGPVQMFNYGMPDNYLNGRVPVTTSHVQQAQAQPDPYAQLIDFDNSIRPPPYAHQIN